MDVIKASKPQLNTFLFILTLQCWHYLHPQMFPNTTHGVVERVVVVVTRNDDPVIMFPDWSGLVWATGW